MMEAWEDLENGSNMGVDGAQVEGVVAGHALQPRRQHGEAERAGRGLHVQQPRLGRLQLQRRASLLPAHLQHCERRANLRRAMHI